MEIIKIILNWFNSPTITNGSTIITGLIIAIIAGFLGYIFGGLKIKKTITATEKHERSKNLEEILNFKVFYEKKGKATKNIYLTIKNLSTVSKTIKVETKIVESEQGPSINEEKDFSGQIRLGPNSSKKIKIGELFVFLGSSENEKCIIKFDDLVTIEDIIEL